MVERRLAAILAADVVGYSRLMGVDEEGVLEALRALREQILDPAIARHRGRIVKLMGDGTLVEFGSVVDAVTCAREIQRDLGRRNESLPDDSRLELRIGINLGDVMIDGDDLYGDGVNIAARLEGLAEPGGIAISGDAWRLVRARPGEDWVDIGEQRLKNIAEPVQVFRWRGSGSAPTPATVVPERPSIAVLPFANMGGDQDQAAFADGLAEDIITTLSRLAGLRVIARNSSFAYRDRAVDIRQIARELGVRHVLEGSVRKGAGRIRVTAQLIDAADGAHVWAERWDRSLDDIFAVQDELTLAVANEMQVRLTEGEQARLRYTATSNFDAWTAWVQGLWHYRQPVAKESMGPARQHWERALALDPGSAAIHAMLGFMHAIDARFGWWDDRGTALGRAAGYVDRALEIDPENADAHTSLSLVRHFEERFEEAVAAARRAVQLAPGSADTAELASFVIALAGFPEEAIGLSKRAITLNPNHPPVYLGQLGTAYRLAGRIEEAIATFREFNARSPGFGLVDLAIIYQGQDRETEARETVRALLEARPGFTVAAYRRTQFRSDKARLAEDLAALAAAGLPPGDLSA